MRLYEAATQAERDAAIDQNIDRKILDAQCALKIERENTKSQILEKYLNIAFFGEGAYGIETAAQTFFGVDASKLTVPQAATLVGLVKAPSDLRPVPAPAGGPGPARPGHLDNMASQNYISAGDGGGGQGQPDPAGPAQPPAAWLRLRQPEDQERRLLLRLRAVAG